MRNSVITETSEDLKAFLLCMKLDENFKVWTYGEKLVQTLKVPLSNELLKNQRELFVRDFIKKNKAEKKNIPLHQAKMSEFKKRSHFFVSGCV